MNNIDFVCATEPTDGNSIIFFVKIDEYYYWFEKNLANDEVKGTLEFPGSTLEDLLSVWFLKLEDFPTLSKDNVQKFITEDDQTKVLGYILKHKEKLEKGIKWYRENEQEAI